MANFTEALKITLSPGHEGGYANDPNDSGGESWQGVSRKNFPLWDGWEIIDQYGDFKNDHKKMDQILFAIPELAELVQILYEKEFWNKIKGYAITSQNIANKLFDVSVNIGCFHGAKCLQMALYDLGSELDIDGIIGDKTIEATNKSEYDILSHKFKEEAEEYYINLSKPQKYKDAWIKRLYS